MCRLISTIDQAALLPCAARVKERLKQEGAFDPPVGAALTAARALPAQPPASHSTSPVTALCSRSINTCSNCSN